MKVELFRPKLQIIGIIVVALALMGLKEIYKMRIKEPLNVAYGNPWKSIHPGMQHTIIADLVLSNQFEALVGSNDEGLPIPLAAKQWEISPDFMKVTFKIDNTKTFSDGKVLTSEDFKKSWEASLKLDPKSHNNSLLDVLYKLRGFESFSDSGEISGIQTPDPETLILLFKTPFRMVLDHLQGNRFSSFREQHGSFLGTGRYAIQEKSADELLLFDNQHIQDSPAFRVLSLENMNAINALINKKIDIVAYAFGTNLPDNIGEFPFISTVVGQDAIHIALQLNSFSGHLFSDEKMRRGLQYLIHKYLKSHPELIGNPNFTHVDPQIYLPTQAGRLNESEVDAEIERNQKYGKLLIEMTERKPLVVWTLSNTKIQEALKAIGLKLSPSSGTIPIEKYFETSYQSTDYDILLSGFSVANGDPDGIYHKLGKNGAIRGKAILAKDTSELLEKGREILDFTKLDNHYQNVSKTFLREVPLVHLGFSKNVTLYRNDVVKINSTVMRRNQGHLHIFERL